MHTFYLEKIKSFEGFTPTAKPDYAQHSNGYGTKALFPGEQIDQAEAQRRFADEISKARQFVDRHAADWDEGTKAALTSLTFNAGTKWASSGLGDAVRAGDADAVKERFLQYTKAGGDVLPGLAARRFEEVKWIGSAGDLKIGGAEGAASATVARLDNALFTTAPSPGEAAQSGRAPTGTSMFFFDQAEASTSLPARISPATAMAVNLLAVEIALERNGDERDRAAQSRANGPRNA